MKRKIRKFRGGGMDMGNKKNQAQSAKMADFTKSPLASGNQGAANTSQNISTGNATNNKVQNTNVKSNLTTGSVSTNNLTLPPIGPFSLAIKGLLLQLKILEEQKELKENTSLVKKRSCQLTEIFIVSMVDH